MKNFSFKNIILLIFFLSSHAIALEFNSDELILLTGKGSELASDEGYLLLSLDSDVAIDNLIIKSLKFGNNFKLKNIAAGENFALLKMKSGNYFWAVFWYYFKGGNVRYNYKKNKYTFTIEPGVINYPGTWSSHLKFTERLRAYHKFTSTNKAAYELKKLRKKHQDIFSKYPFKFQGLVKDNYSEFYNKIKSTSLNKHTEYTYTKYNIEQGISKEIQSFNNIANYLQDSTQSFGNFSPDGRFLVLKMVDQGISYIRVLNLTNYKFATIVKKKMPKLSYIDEVEWIDNDTIYYSVYYDDVYNERIAHLEIDAFNQIIGAKHLKIPISGRIIDSLHFQENTLYFAKSFLHSRKKNGIYKIDVSNDKAIRKTTKKPFKIIKKLEDAVYWLTANNGEIRFIITSEFNKKDDVSILSYWFLMKNSEWKKIYTTPSDQDIKIPLLISQDLNYLYVTTNKFDDKVSIHKYSTHDFSHQGVFYKNDAIEITGLKTDSLTNEIIGVIHIEQGFPKIKYFENKNDKLMPLRKKYPNHKFYSIQKNKKIHKTLIFATNEYSKGSWSIYDNKTHAVDKLFETDPDYAKLEKGIFLTIKIKASDGVDIEGYLVVPKNTKGKKPPLVVIPHGGPIGIRDFAYNNDVQHFYASQGIATLKVNYRGSGGFGKNFQELGQKQWGKKIESDINEMVNHVIDNYNISQNKICTMGSSYGGYSAIMLSILYPDRYKCAVSLAGVMDIPLMFTSSDFRNNKKTIENFIQLVGDPKTQYDELIESSPLYLVNKIQRPILLFHGANDERVTLEHSIRMKEILDLTNKESELIILENEGHSFSTIESEIVYIARSLRFIKEHLKLSP